MENEFLTSGLACWNRQVKRAERASGPPVRLSAFTVDDQPQAPETHTPRGLHLCLPVFQPACASVALCFSRPVTSVGLHLCKADVETEHEGLTCRVER